MARVKGSSPEAQPASQTRITREWLMAGMTCSPMAFRASVSRKKDV